MYLQLVAFFHSILPVGTILSFRNNAPTTSLDYKKCQSNINNAEARPNLALIENIVWLLPIW